MAADSLTRMGYTNVHSLKGGIGKWKVEGNPVVLSSEVFSDPIQQALKAQAGHAASH
jgi:3-mercaptopyruvate sulfurtransferase SseA